MQVKQVLVVEGVINLVIVLSKMSVGIMTGSSAIIADACHSITDVFNNLIAYWANRISNQPADAEHPYGHRKFEQLAIFTLASFLVFIAFELVIRSIENFGKPVEQSQLGLVIMVLTLVLNFGLASWEGFWAKKLNSNLLAADAGHTASDVLTSLTVLFGWQLAANGYVWMDTVITILVACFIWFLAFKLFQKAIPVLVDQRIHDKQTAYLLIKQIKQVKSISRFRSRSDGFQTVADVVVSVEPQLTTEQGHQIADKIESVLKASLSIDEVMVHVEPYGSETAQTKE